MLESLRDGNTAETHSVRRFLCRWTTIVARYWRHTQQTIAISVTRKQRQSDHDVISLWSSDNGTHLFRRSFANCMLFSDLLSLPLLCDIYYSWTNLSTTAWACFWKICSLYCNIANRFLFDNLATHDWNRTRIFSLNLPTKHLDNCRQNDLAQFHLWRPPAVWLNLKQPFYKLR